MDKKGFGSEWRSWIRGYLSTVSFSVLINGRPRGKFKGSNGLRPGDPLSPFLFILVADGLGRLMEKAKLKGIFKGFVAGKVKIEVLHLQFVDDTLFFAKPDASNLMSLVRLLDIFCLALGLKINMAKSVLLGINLGEEETQHLVNIIGCSAGSWPIKYLAYRWVVILEGKISGVQS